MSEYLLVHEIYSPKSIDMAIAVFSEHCVASAQHENERSVLSVEASDEIASELLNYILTTSCQDLLL